MKAALVVHRVSPDVEANLQSILDAAHAAADAGADLVLFAEAVLTGLINNDDPGHDLPLGQPVPGPFTDALAQVARRRRICLGAGLLERAGDSLYDAAVLLGPAGEVALHYRRVHPGWHGPSADPAVYAQGTALSQARTALGSFTFLLCGDLFDDALVAGVQALSVDWLLYPLARDCAGGPCDQEWWDHEVEAAYVPRVQRAGVTTLMVNYLADPSLTDDCCFGGAAVIAADGAVVARLPVGCPGILEVTL